MSGVYRAMPTDRTTHVTRRICFYRIAFIDTSEERHQEHAPSEVFRELDALEWSEIAGKRSRYLFHPPGVANALFEVDIDGKGVVKAEFGRISRHNIPDVEHGGTIDKLDLAKGEGLFVMSHLMIHPSGIMALERVNDGPSLAGLKRYIRERCGGLIDLVSVVRIPTIKFVQLIPHISEVRFFDLAIRRKHREFLDDIDRGMAGAIRRASNWAEFDEYAFRGIMRDKKKKGPLLRSFWENIAGRLRDRSLTKELERLRVGVRIGEEARTLIFDLLDAQLCTEAEVRRLFDRSKNARSEDIFREMEEAFKMLKEEIENGWEIADIDIKGPIQQTLSED